MAPPTDHSDAALSPHIERYLASDGYPLHLRHWVPSTTPQGYVVAMHGIQSHSGWYEFSSQRLREAGFDVRFLEYWDEKGCFHYWEWSDKAGRVNRSSRHVHRNQVTPLSYTSLIIDAVKPKHT